MTRESHTPTLLSTPYCLPPFSGAFPFASPTLASVFLRYTRHAFTHNLCACWSFYLYCSPFIDYYFDIIADLDGYDCMVITARMGIKNQISFVISEIYHVFMKSGNCVLCFARIFSHDYLKCWWYVLILNKIQRKEFQENCVTFPFLM